MNPIFGGGFRARVSSAGSYFREVKGLRNQTETMPRLRCIGTPEFSEVLFLGLQGFKELGL